MKLEDFPPHIQDQLRSQLDAAPTRMPVNAEDPIEYESDLHDRIIDYCRAKSYYAVHARMDRRTTVAVGTPDFAIAMPGGRMVWLECKRNGAKATPAQQATIAHLQKLGHIAAVVDNWPDALKLL
jgi:hypothetical protein